MGVNQPASLLDPGPVFSRFFPPLIGIDKQIIYTRRHRDDYTVAPKVQTILFSLDGKLSREEDGLDGAQFLKYPTDLQGDESDWPAIYRGANMLQMFNRSV